MPLSGRCLLSLAVAASLFLHLPGDAGAVDPRFELDTKDLDSRGGASAAGAGRTKRSPVSSGHKTDAASRYTVKPGDHLFRILMHEYGYTDKQAEALIPVVRKMNNIGNIRELRVGSTITIPLKAARRGDGVKAAFRAVRGEAVRSPRSIQSYRLAGRPAAVDDGVVSVAGELWERLVPQSSASGNRGVEFGGDNFSLSIDPEQFPTLVAQDGATILVDAGGRLPPPVMSLLHDRGEQVRIVSGNPGDRKRFFASLLEAGGFFSVAEDFTVDFGTDPQLTVTSDFKVEKSPESLLRQELVLLNVSGDRAGTPAGLASFLRLQGFQLLELYPAQRTATGESGHRIHRIAAGKVAEMADRLISSLDIRYNRDTMIELYGPGDSGIRLNVRADRFFEVGGVRYVITHFNGDPVFYTLMRLLETRGYRVVVLEERDDFRRVAEKLAGGMGMSGRYGTHSLWSPAAVPYAVRMSGYMFRNPRGGGKVLLTDREIDPLIEELATLNGYTVSSSRE